MRPAYHQHERRMLEMDWKLIEAFDLNNIDTTLLQEMVPSLTFGLVTEISCQSPRMSCKLICMLQLVVETFIMCRKADAHEVYQLREEIIAVSNERDEFRLRLKESKADLKAMKSQLSRCTTLLKSCGHVLRAHGCTPNAISALEAMLATSETFNPTNEPKIAHLCAFCGKAFGSQDFLLKHIDRRHASSPEQTVVKSGNSLDSNEKCARENADLLGRLELLLVQHETAMKKAANDEVEKLKELRNELLLERNVVNELKVARSDLQWRLEETRHEVLAARYDKEDAMKQLATLKEEMKQLENRVKMEATTRPTPMASNVGDQLTIHRLEQALEQANEALASARTDMKTQHESHLALLRANESMKSSHRNQQLFNDAASQTNSLPVQSMACQAEIVGVLESCETLSQLLQEAPANTAKCHIDSSTQTNTDDLEHEERIPQRVAMKSREVQTDEITTKSVELTDNETQTISIHSPNETEEKNTTTNSTQTEPDLTNAIPQSVALGYIPSVEGKKEEIPSISSTIDVNLNETYIRETLDLVTKRAQAYGDHPSRLNQLPDVVFERRKYLTINWEHGNEHVNKKIQDHVHRLNSALERYGLSDMATHLTKEQYGMALGAFKGHLHVLPVTLLEKMVAIEQQLQHLLETKWIPSENQRRDSIKVLKSRMDAIQSQREDWISKILHEKKLEIDVQVVNQDIHTNEPRIETALPYQNQSINVIQATRNLFAEVVLNETENKMNPEDGKKDLDPLPFNTQRQEENVVEQVHEIQSHVTQDERNELTHFDENKEQPVQTELPKIQFQSDIYSPIHVVTREDSCQDKPATKACIMDIISTSPSQATSIDLDAPQLLLDDKPRENHDSDENDAHTANVCEESDEVVEEIVLDEICTPPVQKYTQEENATSAMIQGDETSHEERNELTNLTNISHEEDVVRCTEVAVDDESEMSESQDEIQMMSFDASHDEVESIDTSTKKPPPIGKSNTAKLHTPTFSSGFSSSIHGYGRDRYTDERRYVSDEGEDHSRSTGNSNHFANDEGVDDLDEEVLSS